MSTHTAVAVHSGTSWVIMVDEIGTAQTRSLARAEEAAARLIRSARDPLDDSEISVEINIALAPELEEDIQAVRKTMTDAAEHQARADAQSHETVKRLHATGMTGRDIATVLGITPTRVFQILSRTD